VETRGWSAFADHDDGNELVWYNGKAANDAEMSKRPGADLTDKSGSPSLAPKRPSYRLAELLTRYEAKDRHPEQNWGMPEGQEAW